MGVKRPWRVCSRDRLSSFGDGWVVATYATREKAIEVAGVLRAEEMEWDAQANVFVCIIWVEGPPGEREVIE